MPEVLLKRADDSGEFDSTLVRFGDETTYSTTQLYPTHYRRANNPMIEAIKVWLKDKLRISRKSMYRRTWNSNNRTRGYYTPVEEEPTPVKTVEFSHTIYIGDEGYVILFNKVGTRYFINGMMGNKSVLIAALARTIFKSCFSDDPLELDRFLIKHIQLPENVSYALENRAPYHFYLEGEDGQYSKRIECRLKTNIIGDNKIAIELSDGIWGQMSIRELNVYMNSYLNKKNRGSWSNLTPSALWEKVMKRLPTEAEEHLMVAFLNQNRTSKVVKERARDLMVHLSSRYPDRVKINWGSPDKLLDVSENPTIMYINGKIADWKLTDRGLKSQGQQNVSTFVWIHEEDSEKGEWRGPICVDNLDNKSPTGDQFVTRALGLLNDDLLVNRVSTIKSYLNSRHEVAQNDQRISLFQKE